jgi:hypothetical protein
MALTPAQQHVADQLKSVGASLYVPLVGSNEVDFAVRGDDGQYIEIRVLEATGPRAFTMGKFRPKPHVFFACVSAEEDWVIPSNVFERFAKGSPGGPSHTLDLDADDMGETLGERLTVYRDRWALIAQFRKYRSTLSDPVSLQMLLSMS